MHRVVILGGGTGGTLVANRLHRRDPELEIVVVDADDCHVYQPGLLFLPFGLASPQEIVRSRAAQLHTGIDFRLAEVDRIEPAESTVHLADGTELAYDALVIATGARLLPEETEGLTGPGWNERAFTFYSLEGAQALAEGLRRFQGGRLVVGLVDLPVKCPVAPLEFAFLADWHLHERGLRDRTEIVYVTPLDSPFTKATCSRELSKLLDEKDVRVETEFATASVDGEAGVVSSWDGREIPFDLLVLVPLHGGAACIERSPGLGDELGFVVADPHTLQAKAAPNIFAIGDAANVPTSKAGSVTHFEGETVVDNVLRVLAGDLELAAGFDGHSNCFIETGFGKALLIDFNYETEPLPGRFPDGRLGPLPLMRESRLNHMGKLMFQWLYWHVLLPGRELPGIPNRMSMAGKRPA